jgi:hypothetical protein
MYTQGMDKANPPASVCWSRAPHTFVVTLTEGEGGWVPLAAMADMQTLTVKARMGTETHLLTLPLAQPLLLSTLLPAVRAAVGVATAPCAQTLCLPDPRLYGMDTAVYPVRPASNGESVALLCTERAGRGGQNAHWR